jgi:hypothetical protein
MIFPEQQYKNAVTEFVEEMRNDIIANIETNLRLTSKDKIKTKNNTDVLRVFTTKKQGEIVKGKYRGLLPSLKFVGNPQNITEILVDNTSFTLRLGTKVEYAGYNEFGTKHIKARPFFFNSIQQYYKSGVFEQTLKDLQNKLTTSFNNLGVVNG